MKKILKIIMGIIIIFTFLYIIFYLTDPPKKTLITTYVTIDKKYELRGYVSKVKKDTIKDTVFIDLYDKKTGKIFQKYYYSEYGERYLQIDQIDKKHIKVNGHILSLEKIKENDYSL